MGDARRRATAAKTKLDAYRGAFAVVFVLLAFGALSTLGYGGISASSVYGYGYGYGYEYDEAHLIVVKHVVNGDGGSASASSFTMTINGVTATGGNSFSGSEAGTNRTVTPGNYSVTEAGPSGYDASFSADCTGSIALGQTKTCTVTNNDYLITTVAPGGTASTGAPTPGDPVQTSITSPNGGTVTINDQEPITQSPPSSYTFVGVQAEITAPDATKSNPLLITFNIDGSVLTANGLDYTTLQIFRNGALIPACGGNSGNASPDPCVANRTPFPMPSGSGASITVRTSHASFYNFGLRVLTVTGFFAPIQNPPTLNAAQAGSNVPLKFSLNGFQGFDVFAGGYPQSVKIDCTSLAPVGSAVAASASSFTYDAKLDQYNFSWKTDKSWANTPAGPCRQVVMRFVSGDELRANFKFTK